MPTNMPATKSSISTISASSCLSSVTSSFVNNCAIQPLWLTSWQKRGIGYFCIKDASTVLRVATFYASDTNRWFKHCHSAFITICVTRDYTIGRLLAKAKSPHAATVSCTDRLLAGGSLKRFAFLSIYIGRSHPKSGSFEQVGWSQWCRHDTLYILTVFWKRFTTKVVETGTKTRNRNVNNNGNKKGNRNSFEIELSIGTLFQRQYIHAWTTNTWWTCVKGFVVPRPCALLFFS